MDAGCYARIWRNRPYQRGVDAIERLLSAHLLPGDSVAVEDPCFLSSISMLRYSGFNASPVSIDREGMQPEQLEQALSKSARAVILTPRAHNPTGCSLSAARAAAIQVLSRYPQTLVIIDDHFALLANTAPGDCTANTALGGGSFSVENVRPGSAASFCRQRYRYLGEAEIAA